MTARKLKILIVSAEVAPFAKVGGLADVAGALPKALEALGHDVRVAMPAYKMIEDDPRFAVEGLIPHFPVPINDNWCACAWVKTTRIGGNVPVYLIGSDTYFRDATESKKVYSLEPEPYIFFDRAVTEFVPRLRPAWSPDVIHCNDWQTGLIPPYLDAFYSSHPTWSETARVFTIHNLAYQGDFDRGILQLAGLPERFFTYDRLEFYGKMSFMKGGLVFSQLANTVSETYAKEIQTPEYGWNLEGLLQYLDGQGRLTGIVNGIDFAEYDPATDPRIPAKFSADDVSGKAMCKKALQKECGLPASARAAVIGIISRLADQKGFDLIEASATRLLDLPIQLVILGTGAKHYEMRFQELVKQYPAKVKAAIGFDADLAQRIYAGCDMFLMPSRFEPCGLGQLMSLRYGTIPIVRATGGLADTIEDFDASGKGTGFVFQEYSAEALFSAVDRAVKAFQDKDSWRALVDRAMRADFSWGNSARHYIDLYHRALSAARIACAA